jgi:nucleoside-diphosphate-sugar epimerase
MPPKLIPTLVKGALSGETVPLASGEEIRDFTYVEDIVEAFLRAGAREMAASEGKTLNLGSANVATVEEVARTIMELIPSNRGFCLNSLKHRREEAKFLIPETAEAWDFLGWSPAHSLRDGLKKTIAWFDACRR